MQRKTRFSGDLYSIIVNATRHGNGVYLYGFISLAKHICQHTQNFKCNGFPHRSPQNANQGPHYFGGVSSFVLVRIGNWKSQQKIPSVLQTISRFL